MERRSTLAVTLMMGILASSGFGAAVLSDNFTDTSLSQWEANFAGYIGTQAYVQDGVMIMNPPDGTDWPYIWQITVNSQASFTDVGRYELTWRQWHDLEAYESRNTLYMSMPGGFSMTWWDWANPGQAGFCGVSLGSLANGSYKTWATYKVVVEPQGESTHLLAYKDGSLILDQTVAQAADFVTYNKIVFSTNAWASSPTQIDDVQLTLEQYSLQGVVVVDNYLGDLDAVGVKFVLEPTAGGDNITRSVMLTSDGVFTIPQLPAAGTYNVYAKAYASLRTVLTDVPVPGFPSVLPTPIVLSGDDINGDNVVSFEDFSILQNSYGQSGAVAVNPAAAAAATGGCGSLGLALMALLGLAAVGLSLRSEK